jgi:type VI secretion system secreted protein Hcp
MSPEIGSSASDVFLHVQAKRAGKIKGEASTKDHAGDIIVSAWHWGVSSSSSIGSTAKTARRSYKSLVVRKGTDSATTGLLNALATNDELKEVTLSMRKAGDEQQDYLRVTLSNARVVSIDIDVDELGRAMETITMNFTKVDVEYRIQQAAGARGGAYTFQDEVFTS